MDKKGVTLTFFIIIVIALAIAFIVWSINQKGATKVLSQTDGCIGNCLTADQCSAKGGITSSTGTKWCNKETPPGVDIKVCCQATGGS
tara:strand:- start:633 stop:896 length:264 start_codon:yes stop_codon:yes gene_type:complete